MKLYFMRHGQTEYNTKHLLQGRMNTDLTADGRRQAAEARQHFADAGIAFDRVYSSPLNRAFDTAVLSTGFPEDQIRTDERLLEIGFGPLEAQRVEDLGPTFQLFFTDPEHYVTPEGAETYDELLTRTKDFLAELQREQPDGNTLVVSHGGTIHAIYYVLCGGPLKEFWTMTMGNCGYFVVTEEDGNLTVSETHFNEHYRTLPDWKENE